MMEKQPSHEPHPQLHEPPHWTVFVNNRPCGVHTATVTARFVIEVLAHEQVGQVVLASRCSTGLTKHTDLDAPIDVFNGLHFVTLHQGPTPVS